LAAPVRSPLSIIEQRSDITRFFDRDRITRKKNLRMQPSKTAPTS
jgi:hypothetical protein